eukprot:CAMPEP_0173112764 /NCGR_PEP_ID=MMETSP1102-20130122/46303_1 /TAXON_ID=49646 /ORGANISM="Geminigera sp., Strain Caron Lab Isolate" /LENGTH=71 /DNA_ID=CAMNT_0014014079 /DNA_START=254 /DNA_END=469 /DNA_ORIENTATION=+
MPLSCLKFALSSSFADEDLSVALLNASLACEPPATESLGGGNRDEVEPGVEDDENAYDEERGSLHKCGDAK